MKPELLVLEGVYSYKNRTEIDFNTLCAAELFGIFGNVGSGKSAILEAVTYVLYGKIERLSNRVYYNMMNLASNRMSIDFSFLHKDKKYRFTFETKRNKKDFEKIETPQRSAYELDGGEWKPLFDKDGLVSVDEIIGLNYDNFRRTIIVPQGRFQEFLHLEKSKRTAMLMELFNLNRFDLFSKAAALANRNKEKAAGVEGELSGLSEISDEAVAAAEEEAGVIDERVGTLAAEIKKSDAELKNLEGLAELHQQLEAAQKKFAEKSGLENEFIQRKNILQEYEDCMSKFKSSLEILKTHERDAEFERVKFSDAEKRLEKGRLDLVDSEMLYEAVKPEQDKIGLYEKQAEWFNELISLRITAADAVRVKAEIESVQVVLEEKIGAAETLSTRAEELRSAVFEGDRGDLLPEEMNSLDSVYQVLRKNAEELASGQKRLDQAGGELTLLKEKLAEYDNLEEEESLLESRADALRKLQFEAELSKGLGDLAQQLSDGNPCPVCGSLDHPAPAAGVLLDVSEIEKENESLSEARSELNLRLEAFRSLKNEELSLQGRYQSTAEHMDVMQAEREALESGFPDGDFGPNDYSAFKLEYDRLTAARKEREKNQIESAKLSAEQEKLNREIARQTEIAGRLRLALAGYEAKIDSLEARVDPDFLDANREADKEALSERGRLLSQKIADVKVAFSTAEEQKQDAAILNEKNLTELDVLKKHLSDIKLRQTAAAAELDKILSSSKYESISSVEEVLNRNIDAESERSDIEMFEKGFAALRAEIMGLKTRLDGRGFDQAEYDKASENAGLLKAEYELVKKRQAELGVIIKNLKTGMVRKTALNTEAEALQLRGENLSVLKNIFKANKFADFAATVYLRELCEAANFRFRKLTRESLRLELDETNNFIIRDYLNDGKTRSVKTLSGGQTFQAAFSLSLALADSIGRERSGFFFLDEGFGSLDRESLSLVFDSLKSLKKENRTVGIISHVEELKQEIDTFIIVNKDNEEGSIIKSSWA